MSIIFLIIVVLLTTDNTVICRRMMVNGQFARRIFPSFGNSGQFVVGGGGGGGGANGIGGNGGGKQYRNCEKLNHFASVCRSAKSKCHEPKSKKPIRLIEGAESESDMSHTLDTNEYANYLRYKQSQSYGLFAVSDRQKPANDGPRVSIEINSTKLSFLIDTGAPINVIDEPTYHNIHNRPTLQFT
ncbi:hypothetical protein BpHYR1_052270 [Brachionus plicatilis]|uniref:Uncharacterized protein n=1 Tax=Brachionus plicatilis TaxID=10195 RepID=A0A3M7SR60_BRAPC|nr:hypothetical protein BpHYR1_052270 [Brachionus plicatilis]